jgi:hypothetical protein
LPYQLHLGVTGHRKLANVDAVAKAVDRLLDHIQSTLESASQYPRGRAGRRHNSWCRRPLSWIDGLLVRCTKLLWWSIPITKRRTPPDKRTPVHFTVISALAKGSDRIVAWQVLKRPNSLLQAAVPMALGKYSKDLAEPTDLKEFQDLYDLDQNPTILGISDESKLYSDDSEKRLAARREEYYKAGMWVVERCEILVAIWDGKPTKGRGGTGDVVAAALRRGRRVFWINADDPQAPVKVITATGGTESSGAGPTGLPEWRADDLPVIARELSRKFHQLSAYNRDKMNCGQ